MLVVILLCVLLVAVATLVHYEMLRQLSARLPALPIRNRQKVLVASFVTTLAHGIEIALWGLVMYALVRFGGLGALQAQDGPVLTTFLYFSAETYTSLGFGDITPSGPVRLMAGVEALNGLLLIGWSASYLYIAMERFWGAEDLA